MDLDDTGKAGVSLADLLSAAESGDPLDVRVDAAAMETAKAGCRALADAVSRVGAAQDRQAMADIIADLLRNKNARRALGYAYRLRPAELQAELARLRGFRGLSRDATEIAKAAKEEGERQQRSIDQRSQAAAASHQGRLLDRLTRDIGVTGLRMPPGYELDADGVWLDGEDKVRITHAPVLLSGLSQDLHTDQMRVRISWRRRDGWSTHTVSRQTVMDARGIVALASLGAPVNTGNSRDVVDYLAAFEAANMGTIPDQATTGHMGWQGPKTFVVGHESIGARDVRLVAEGGLDALASGYRPAGTWEGWCAVVDELLADRPLALLGIYAAACTPLLRVLDQPGFVVDWSGETSLGKTTTLRCAASVWGVPDDRGEGIILSWASSSMVGPMTVAHFQQSLPVILDDTKRGKPSTIGAVLYDLPAGQERMKGTAEGGLRAIRRWRTCLLSTGEAPITSFSQAGGTRARTIALRGAPFGEPTDDNRRAAEAVSIRLQEHHGHLGRMVVHHLVEHADVAQLRARFEAIRERYAQAAPSAVAGRLAAYVALLHLTAELCHELGMPRPRCQPLRVAWEAAVEGSREGDPPTEALKALYSWAVAHGDRFETRRHYKDGIPPQGWAGQWTTGRLGFFPELVQELLERWKFDAPGVLDAWHRREWTLTNPGRRTLRARLGTDYARLVAFELGEHGVPVPLEARVEAGG